MVEVAILFALMAWTTSIPDIEVFGRACFNNNTAVQWYITDDTCPRLINHPMADNQTACNLWDARSQCERKCSEYTNEDWDRLDKEEFGCK